MGPMDRTGDAAGRPESSPILSARQALPLLAGVVLMWGANWPVLRMAVGLIGPLGLAVGRLTIGTIALFLAALASGQLRWPDRRDYSIVFWTGVLQMGAYIALVAVALQWVPAGRSAILAYTTPLWVVPLARLWLGERVTGPRLAGLALGMAGVAVLFAPVILASGPSNGATHGAADDKVLLGYGLLLTASVCWAVNIVQIRAHLWRASPLALAPWQTGLALLMLLPFFVALEGSRPIAWSAPLLGALSYNGLIGSALAFWAMTTVNRALPAVTTSLGTLGVPAVGLVGAALFLGEPIGFFDIAGLLLVGAGLALVALSNRKM